MAEWVGGTKPPAAILSEPATGKATVFSSAGPQPPGFVAFFRVRRACRTLRIGYDARMERFTISLDAELAREFDALIAERGYGNRSEAVRDLIRARLETWRQQRDEAPYCVAALSYVYNHHERELGERLTGIQHAHHDLAVATLHAHLDHEHCIEATILRGPTAEVRRCAEAIIAERGVRHGQMNLVAVALDNRHRHDYRPGGALRGRHHVHFRPAR